ncbi:CD48 antigen-like [Anabas testudineus]|uniref:CD48 antigen-like n=1 Tax=Anabas testudineus TaxID=64144 RepID=UPI00143D61FD|nr:CD48 antigen-like [Anabas testudineus]
MTPFVLLVFLLTLCEGSRAVTPVFVQKGNDVLLDVIKADVPEDFILLVWRFNESDVLVTYSPGREPTVFEGYRGRVEFSVKNYSVKLKNLQKTDSGVYTARVTASQEKIVAEYNVTVQDPVSPVSLTVDSVSSSSDSCNITVTCRTQDSNISSTFRCVNQICSEDKREKSKTTTSGTFLHVNLVNDSIICNHSNQVSWTTNTGQTKIQDFCPQHDVVPNGAITAGIAVGVLVSCLLVVVLSIYC